MRESDKHNADHHTTDDTPVLARRDFLKTAGVVVVGIGVANASSAQAPAGASGAWQRGVKSGPPDPAEVDSYLAVHPNNTATMFAGYVDLGQGGPTALCQIAAEELDLEFGQVLMASNDTFVSTNGFTAASRTSAIGGTKCARRRPKHVGCCRPGLGAAEGAGRGSDRGQGRRVGEERPAPLGRLRRAVGGQTVRPRYEPVPYNNRGIETATDEPDVAPPKPRAAYKIVGTSVPRLDMPDKVSGTYQYMQHVRVPGMLHGRVVWPQGQVAGGVTSAEGDQHRRRLCQEHSGGRIVRRQQLRGGRRGTRVGCRSARRSQLKVTWEPFPAVFPGHDGIHDTFRAATTNDDRRLRYWERDHRVWPTRRPRRVRLVPRALRIAWDHGAELRDCRRQGRQRPGDVLRSGHLSDRRAVSPE